MHFLQMDVTAAFLHGETLQEVYVILPDEFRTTTEIEVGLFVIFLNPYMEHQTPHAYGIQFFLHNYKRLILSKA